MPGFNLAATQDWAKISDFLSGGAKEALLRRLRVAHGTVFGVQVGICRHVPLMISKYTTADLLTRNFDNWGYRHGVEIAALCLEQIAFRAGVVTPNGVRRGFIHAVPATDTSSTFQDLPMPGAHMHRPFAWNPWEYK